MRVLAMVYQVENYLGTGHSFYNACVLVGEGIRYISEYGPTQEDAAAKMESAVRKHYPNAVIEYLAR